ncbi:MAG: hypothetical protein NC213_05065 [Acetobacter sp.]|nr:hypothetical protein [Bacteroides sp.]MCM1341096.1 hypothetical protein [Acetobacter sp.]MCM1433571.1 hypothetical protein [Clostridiales bacterium]
MKKVLSILTAALMFFTFPTAVFANDITNTTTKEIEYFSDGSYMVTTIETEADNGIALLATTSTKSSSKSVKYYSSSNDLQWIVTLTGTFSYTGSSATCTKSSATYKVYDSNWKVKSATASKSGRTATGNYTVKRYALGIVTSTKTGTIKISCSNTGVIS